jgi:hypothetical protein
MFRAALRAQDGPSANTASTARWHAAYAPKSASVR